MNVSTLAYALPYTLRRLELNWTIDLLNSEGRKDVAIHGPRRESIALQYRMSCAVSSITCPVMDSLVQSWTASRGVFPILVLSSASSA
jgi:hypothetical protein